MGDIPAGRKVGHAKSHAAAIACAGDECIGLKEREGALELTLEVALKLCATDREGLEQSGDGDGRSALGKTGERMEDETRELTCRASLAP